MNGQIIEGKIVGQKKPWYQKVWLWVLVIVGLIILIGAANFTSTSNKLNTQSQAVDAQMGQIQAALQRRADLIPNLVNSIQGQQKQEKNVYGAIAKARQNYYGAQTQYNNANQKHDQKGQISALGQQEAALNVLVGSIKEAYPKLDSQKDMQTLMVELEGTENRISVERHKYNDLISQYNNTVVRFPGSMVASMTNHKTMSYFNATTSAQNAPTVKF